MPRRHNWSPVRHDRPLIKEIQKRFTHAAALVAATFIGTIVATGVSAQIARIDFQVVESPAFGGESFGDTGSTSAFAEWPTERSTLTMREIAGS